MLNFNVLLLNLLMGFTFADELKINFAEHEKKITNRFLVKNAVEKIGPKNLENYLRDFLYASRPNRLVGSKGHLNSRIFIEKELAGVNSSTANFGVRVYKETFPLKEDENFQCQNIIWEKKGAAFPQEVLVFGANYDLFVNVKKSNHKSAKEINMLDFPGADNNATGVILNLAFVKILETLDLAKTIRIVFFDCDDHGALGTRDFLAKISKQLTKASGEKIHGLIYLTSLGHDTKTTDKENKLRNFYIYDNEKKLIELFKNKKNESYLQMDFKTKFMSHEKNAASHEESFGTLLESLRDTYLPAVIVTQNRDSDFNLKQKTANDFYETLNHKTLYQVYFDLLFTLVAWGYGIP